MSTLKVDEITDAAGTGAPDFSQGIEISSSGVVVDYEEVSGTLDGGFTGGTYRAVRIGKVITITLDSPTNASTSGVTSTVALPATMRPTSAASTVSFNSAASNKTDVFRIQTNGTINLLYMETGTSSRNDTGPAGTPTLSYVIV
jgi:hypothetical protein